MRALKIVEGMDSPKYERNRDRWPYAGKSLSEIFAEMIATGDVKTAIELVSKFVPKEHLVDLETTTRHAITFDSADLAYVFDIARLSQGVGSDGAEDAGADGLRQQHALDPPGGAAAGGILIEG
jgi:hypothetical protein